MRFKPRTVIATLAVLLASNSPIFAADNISQDNISQNDLANMISGCKALEYDYAHYRDLLDAKAFSNIFTTDGEWARSNGRVLKGHDAIASYIKGLEPKDLTSNRALTTTVLVTPVDATTANTTSYALMLTKINPDKEVPVHLSSFHIASESRSLCSLTEDGWKIAKREYTTIFTDAK